MSIRAIGALSVFSILVLLPSGPPAEGWTASGDLTLKVLAEPLHGGRISPMLYGGFVELLDDVVPGMWAEMLGDRGFEGIIPASTWDYFRGEPNVCDRDWDKSPDWSYDAERPFNDQRSCRLDVREGRASRLTQGGLSVHKGLTYLYSGYWRGDSPAVKVRVSLKALCPDGSWTILATSGLPAPGAEWKRFSGTLVSQGTTDRAVLEIEA